MTERQVALAVRSDLEQAAASTALICFVEISHRNLPEPVRVVCDPMDYIWEGNRFVGFLFEFRILSDDDNAPFTEIVVPNVDRRIGNAIRSSTERAKVRLALLPSTAFDLSVDPRVAIEPPVPVYEFEHFEISEVQADVIELRARIELRDYATEPFPALNATQTRFPGLFR